VEFCIPVMRYATNVFQLLASLHILPRDTVESDHNVASAITCPVSLQKQCSKGAPNNAAISSSLGMVTFFKGERLFLLHTIYIKVSGPWFDRM